jgi:hypothetical protein
VLQAKEKFGGLRFYLLNEPPELHAIIQQAENQSYKTCEQCGAPGKARNGGWIKVLCDEHAQGREANEDL